MAVAYIDTQVAVRLHNKELRKISREAARVIESRDLLLSPMAYIELDYLLRTQRIQHSAAAIYAHLNSAIGLNLCPLPFGTVATVAVDIGWTTDPFDKIIVAQARANQNAPLITADSHIREYYASAIW